MDPDTDIGELVHSLIGWSDTAAIEEQITALTGRPADDVALDSNVERCDCCFAQCDGAGSSLEGDIIKGTLDTHADGRWVLDDLIWVRCADTGEVIRVTGWVVDVTVRG